MREVADCIEEDPCRYNQSAYVGIRMYSCGASFCIAGWVAHLRRPELIANFVAVPTVQTANEIHAAAEELLGLTENEALCLFEATWIPVSDLSAPDALRKFAAGAALEDVTTP